MTRYELLLALHIVAAVAWLGSALCVQLLAIRANSTGDQERKRRVADDAEWLATRLFIPSSLAVLLVGILLVMDGPWSFGDAWILLGLAGFAFSFLSGILYISPQTSKIKTLLERMTPEAQTEADLRTARIFLVSRIELVILFLVVVDMVAKPGL